jgi:nucleotide-binding universal stress UspA family protein
MPGVILAVLDHPEAAAELLTAAECLADLIGGAVINALIIRTLPQATITSEEVLTKQRESHIRAQEQTRAAALTEAFRDWARSARSAARLNDVEAAAAEAVAARGRVADYIVTERPVRRHYGTTAQVIPAALFDTDRPVLVVPPGDTTGFGRRIAVAWRDDDRTIRAVLTAMRCLRHAEQVLVLAGQREGAAHPQMPEIVVEHRVPAELFVLPVGRHAFGEALLGKAHELGADMMVMGAYAHDAVRRLVLGGLTKYMLANTDLPLLMRH